MGHSDDEAPCWRCYEVFDAVLFECPACGARRDQAPGRSALRDVGWAASFLVYVVGGAVLGGLGVAAFSAGLMAIVGLDFVFLGVVAVPCAFFACGAWGLSRWKRMRSRWPGVAGTHANVGGVAHPRVLEQEPHHHAADGAASPARSHPDVLRLPGGSSSADGAASPERSDRDIPRLPRGSSSALGGCGCIVGLGVAGGLVGGVLGTGLAPHGGTGGMAGLGAAASMLSGAFIGATCGALVGAILAAPRR